MTQASHSALVPTRPGSDQLPLSLPSGKSNKIEKAKQKSLEKLDHIVTRHSPRLGFSGNPGSLTDPNTDARYLAAGIIKSKSHFEKLSIDADYKHQRSKVLKDKAHNIKQNSDDVSSASRIEQFSLEASETQSLLDQFPVSDRQGNSDYNELKLTIDKAQESVNRSNGSVSEADLKLAITTRDKAFKLLQSLNPAATNSDLNIRNRLFLKKRAQITGKRNRSTNTANRQVASLKTKSYMKSGTSIRYRIQAFAAKVNMNSQAKSLYGNTCSETAKSMNFVKQVLKHSKAITEGQVGTEQKALKSKLKALGTLVNTHKKNIAQSGQSKTNHILNNSPEFQSLYSDKASARELEIEALSLALSLLQEVTGQETEYSNPQMDIIPVQDEAGTYNIFALANSDASADSNGLEIVPV